MRLRTLLEFVVIKLIQDIESRKTGE